MVGCCVAVAFLAVTAASLIWVFKPSEAPRSVAAQWNEAIGRLGIEPVYPPQEDLAVGDIFAMVTSDALEDIAKDPLAGRALKLWHVDLTQDIEESYKAIYRFPDTPSPDDKPSLPATDTVFKTGVPRSNLPIVIFPAFTLVNLKSAGGAGALSGMFDFFMGAAASSNASAEIKISAAETYGVSALTAEARLFGFCKDYATSPVCTEKGLRRQLSMVVGSRITDTVKDEAGKQKYRLGVELALINRVYLARSIETTITREQAMGARTHAGPSKAGNTDRNDSGAPSASGTDIAQPGNAKAQASDLVTLQRKIETQQAQISALEAKIGQSGTSSMIQSANESAIRLTEITKRPVVIGFRSVRWTP